MRRIAAGGVLSRSLGRLGDALLVVAASSAASACSQVAVDACEDPPVVRGDVDALLLPDGSSLTDLAARLLAGVDVSVTWSTGDVGGTSEVLHVRASAIGPDASLLGATPASSAAPPACHAATLVADAAGDGATGSTGVVVAGSGQLSRMLPESGGAQSQLSLEVAELDLDASLAPFEGFFTVDKTLTLSVYADDAKPDALYASVTWAIDPAADVPPDGALYGTLFGTPGFAATEPWDPWGDDLAADGSP